MELQLASTCARPQIRLEAILLGSQNKLAASTVSVHLQSKVLGFGTCTPRYAQCTLLHVRHLTAIEPIWTLPIQQSLALFSNRSSERPRHEFAFYVSDHSSPWASFTLSIFSWRNTQSCRYLPNRGAAFSSFGSWWCSVVCILIFHWLHANRLFLKFYSICGRVIDHNMGHWQFMRCTFICFDNTIG